MSLSFIGSGIHIVFGHVDHSLVSKMLIGGIPEALPGSWLGTRIPGDKLQMARNVVFGYLGLQMSWKSLAPLLIR